MMKRVEAFGASLPDQNPSGLGNFVFNLRFPGQYYDQETGLHYNVFRDYDPATGRYSESDPIGLAGGVNTYAYVGNNPLKHTDPSGLCVGPLLPLCAFVLENAVAINTAGILVAEVVSELPSPISAEASVAGVAKYEVGLFNNLKAKSLVGDGLDIHHAAQSCPASQVIPGYNRLNAPSIAIPQAEHRLIPTISGDYNGTVRDLLAKDIWDLRNYTNTPNSSLQELIQLNMQTYPNSFMK